MRGPSALFLSVLASFGSAACGGEPKPANDPSTAENSEMPTRWEGSSAPDPNQPKRAPAAKVNEAPARRVNEYDKEATDVVLKRAARQVKENCGAAKDEAGKATGPWGKTNVQIVLGSNGHSKGVTVPDPYAGKPVGKCVEKAFTNLTFPPWAGSDTPVDWEVELVEPADATKK